MWLFFAQLLGSKREKGAGSTQDEALGFGTKFWKVLPSAIGHTNQQRCDSGEAHKDTGTEGQGPDPLAGVVSGAPLLPEHGSEAAEPSSF